MKKTLVTRTIFILLFGVLAFIGMRINFSSLLGQENQFFTLFQFFGPIAGGFLGAGIGACAVLIAQLADAVVLGKEFEMINLIRLAPMIFAAYYFGRNKREAIGIAIPLLAIAAFIIHPVGRQVWFYSLYWLIPVAVRLIPEKFGKKTLPRSLGATFTAHAVGTALWIWTVPSTPAFWLTLIPIVALERSLFTLGISGSYLVMQKVLNWIVKVLHVSIPQSVLRLKSKEVAVE